MAVAFFRTFLESLVSFLDSSPDKVVDYVRHGWEWSHRIEDEDEDENEKNKCNQCCLIDDDEKKRERKRESVCYVGREELQLTRLEFEGWMSETAQADVETSQSLLSPPIINNTLIPYAMVLLCMSQRETRETEMMPVLCNLCYRRTLAPSWHG